MNNNMTVAAVKYTDVRDKEQLYVTIKNQKGEKVVINVGNKTYDAVKKITEGELTITEGKLELEQIGEDILPESLINAAGMQTLKTPKPKTNKK